MLTTKANNILLIPDSSRFYQISSYVLMHAYQPESDVAVWHMLDYFEFLFGIMMR